jgi:hypothetical protein
MVPFAGAMRRVMLPLSTSATAIVSWGYGPIRNAIARGPAKAIGEQPPWPGKPGEQQRMLRACGCAAGDWLRGCSALTKRCCPCA